MPKYPLNPFISSPSGAKIKLISLVGLPGRYKYFKKGSKIEVKGCSNGRIEFDGGSALPDNDELPQEPILKALDSDKVSDAELGRIVRLHSNVVRAPRVIVLRPSWFEKVTAVGLILLLLVMGFGAWVNREATLENRIVSRDVIGILCDPDRLVPGVTPGIDTIEVCERHDVN